MTSSVVANPDEATQHRLPKGKVRSPFKIWVYVPSFVVSAQLVGQVHKCRDVRPIQPVPIDLEFSVEFQVYFEVQDPAGHGAQRETGAACGLRLI